ncbi:uncharacterized protein LOC122248700 [Penaeus japonicus]|uniref:uncharacterized protein LOC122248700 n=1 Tax=Penaeus japonicus TaxID=27405 RepID=UPI001C711D79|nr:uncharacterized protein LOC122248700 [Penaeus japonicus]
MKLIVGVVAVVGVWAAVCSASPVEGQESQERDGRFLGLNFPFLNLVTVTVKPTPCLGKSDNSSGTCTTKGQCDGREDGTCANGYGVCCIFEKRCGSTIKQNVTFLVNDNYPDALKAIGNCQYNIEKANSDVCQLRLDFLSMNLANPNDGAGTGVATLCEKDTFSFVGSAGGNPTVICGDNSGQHMYLDIEGNGVARINIATTDDSIDRSWRIKVTQIPCNSVSRAPPGCLQYYTDYSGKIESFNYQQVDTPAAPLHLANQRYTICIRANEGFCGIRYTADHFSLSGDTGTPLAVVGDANCLADLVIIPGLTKDGKAAASDRYCGSQLDPLETYSKPFEIRVVTDDAEDIATDINNQGFSIRYTQIPC